ncbi:MAG: class I SAM-dependent methyltransferase [Spirochaetaceae bacterium]|jgi:SAM-dependent methyltransferase|nr:class I SAM-dependent methyltransferase [Spirochaetaceae bacterium]
MERPDLQHIIEVYWTIAAPYLSEIVREDLAGEQRALWREKILRNSPKPRGMDVLDVGCGPGFFSIILSEAGNRVIAVDCTARMLEEARINAEEAGVRPTFLKMDSHTMGFPDGSFDLVVSRDVTWTLYDPARAYAEWKRVLRPGGRILIFDANCGGACFKEQPAFGEKTDGEVYGEPEGDPLEIYAVQEEYSGKMFLSDKLRPAWDITTLSLLDMDVYTEMDVGSELSAERGRRLNSGAPLFLVAAEKRLDLRKVEKVFYKGVWKITHTQIRWDNSTG